MTTSRDDSLRGRPRRWPTLALLLVVGGLGVVLGKWFLQAPEAVPPDPAALVTKVREALRLETLRVTLYKKIDFTPEPKPTDSFWDDVMNWARHSLVKPRGKAIVFAEARLGYDFQQWDASNVRARGDSVAVKLPPLDVVVELRPGETEIIGSNLNSAETAELLERARVGFEREVRADEELRQRARSSAERSLRALFLGAGFRQVQVVDELPVEAGWN